MKPITTLEKPDLKIGNEQKGSSINVYVRINQYSSYVAETLQFFCHIC
uniref:Uncharacterized protein n=1 Tax=Romanomermis culicivorax TaxID=13658 RepID=A0A915JL39_ROMCU